MPSKAISLTLLLVCFGASLALQGCILGDEDPIDEGIIRAEQADVFSSTALVSLKVATVQRGEVVDIMRRASVTGPTYTENWVQVRLHNDEETNGWIEARHVVSQEIVDKTKEIAGTPEDLPAFGRGRLKVNQRLRLEPSREADLAAVLSRGTEFDLIGKAQSAYTPESASKKPDTSAEEEQAEEVPEELETRTDTWYRVRLDDGSIVRGGWILAPSISLQVPDEILHLEGDGRRFVAWQSIGQVRDEKYASEGPDQMVRKHYFTLMRRGNAPDDVDFERVYTLIWSTNEHRYTAPWVEGDMRGVFPMTQRQEGNKTIVTVHVLNAEDKPVPVEYEVSPNEKGTMTVKRLTPAIPGEKISSRRR